MQRSVPAVLLCDIGNEWMPRDCIHAVHELSAAFERRGQGLNSCVSTVGDREIRQERA